MEIGPSTRVHRAKGAGAVLALALFAAIDQVTAEAPPPPAVAVERAAVLLQERAFDQAEELLRAVVAADPGNRRAKEMLAFALESKGDLEGERLVRAGLAADFPDDPRAQADYGRVLERAGAESEALAAYRRARALKPGLSGIDTGEIDAAIARMEGRTAVEVGTPISSFSDPDAAATRIQAGAAVPLGSRSHVSMIAARTDAEAANGPATTTTDLLAASFTLRHRSGASLVAGPRLHMIAPREDAPRDVALGGFLAGRGPLGGWLEADLTAEFDAPWEEAAIAVLHGGRSRSALVRLYAHLWNRRLLLQVGGQRRRLSILGEGNAAGTRPEAGQSLLVAGADVVLWSKPAAAPRGEMLDDALVAPAALPSAIVVGYRRYELTTRTSPDFASLINLAPRGSVDELSTAFSAWSPRRHVGVEMHGGLGRDAERQARFWRAGGSLVWAPVPALRCALAYEESTDITTGLSGQRQAGSLSVHVDF